MTTRRVKILALLMVMAGLGLVEWCMAATTVTLSSIKLTTSGGATALFAGQTNQLAMTCIYSDKSQTKCSTKDAHGNVASGYVSSAGAVNVSATGMVTAASAGTATISAKVGSKTATTTITVLPAGTYAINITLPAGTYSATFNGGVISLNLGSQ